MEDSPKVEGLTGDALATAREMVFYHPICPGVGGGEVEALVIPEGGIHVRYQLADAKGDDIAPIAGELGAIGFRCP